MFTSAGFVTVTGTVVAQLMHVTIRTGARKNNALFIVSPLFYDLC